MVPPMLPEPMNPIFTGFEVRFGADWANPASGVTISEVNAVNTAPANARRLGREIRVMLIPSSPFFHP